MRGCKTHIAAGARCSWTSGAGWPTCGAVAGTMRWNVVASAERFAWLPADLQCQSCKSPWNAPDSRVTPEIELAIETALHQLAAHMQTWPDGWHVDPHGTGNNPHVWFGKGNQSCPCGEMRSFRDAVDAAYRDGMITGAERVDALLSYRPATPTTPHPEVSDEG